MDRLISSILLSASGVSIEPDMRSLKSRLASGIDLVSPSCLSRGICIPGPRTARARASCVCLSASSCLLASPSICSPRLRGLSKLRASASYTERLIHLFFLVGCSMRSPRSTAELIIDSVGAPRFKSRVLLISDFRMPSDPLRFARETTAEY